MRIGDKLIMGSYAPYASRNSGYYYSNSDPEPIVWLKASPKGHFVTQNVIDILAYDSPHTGVAVEPGAGYGDPARRLRNEGSACWPNSNLCQFLNGEGNWFRQIGMHEAPNYSDHPGFLTYFEHYELAVMERDPCGNKVRLPTLDEVVNKGFSLFHRSMRAYPDIRISSKRLMGYWLLGNDFNHTAEAPGSVQYITDSGYNARLSPCRTRPVRPMVQLDHSAELEPVPGMDRTWRIKGTPVKKEPEITVDRESFFALFGLGMP
jgi:hypothetical protein